MRRAFLAVLFAGALWLTGCSFLDWASTEDPVTRTTPAAQAAGEIARDTLTGFEAGGIWAGVGALAFTSLKTGLRLWRRYGDHKRFLADVRKYGLPVPLSNEIGTNASVEVKP